MGWPNPGPSPPPWTEKSKYSLNIVMTTLFQSLPHIPAIPSDFACIVLKILIKFVSKFVIQSWHYQWDLSSHSFPSLPTRSCSASWLPCSHLCSPPAAQPPLRQPNLPATWISPLWRDSAAGTSGRRTWCRPSGSWWAWGCPRWRRRWQRPGQPFPP